MDCKCSHEESYCISIVPIFNHLERSQLAEMMETVHSTTFKKGELIYRAGEKSDALYILHKGKVKIYQLSETGKEILLRILHPGDFTGELALFKESTHSTFAEAMTDTEICMMKRTDLQNFLMKYPSISLKILEEFSKRLNESENQTTRFATEKVETRIALFLAECVDREGSTKFTLPMSKKDLASYLGTTPETISRKLSDFEQQGFIKQKGRREIEVIDLDQLLLY